MEARSDLYSNTAFSLFLPVMRIINDNTEAGLPLSALVDLKETEELFKSKPPSFGHAVLKYFSFDPEYINLNHGRINNQRKGS